MIAVGKNVVLRRLSAADLGAFQSYRADPIVARYQGWKAMSDAQALAFLNAMSEASMPNIGGWCQIGIADADSNILIGDLGLHVAQDHSEAELGVTLSRAAQGQSRGFDAVRLAVSWVFSNTSVDKIVAITDQRNAGAQALLTRLGWPCVATLGPEVEIKGVSELVFEHLRADSLTKQE